MNSLFDNIQLFKESTVITTKTKHKKFNEAMDQSAPKWLRQGVSDADYSNSRFTTTGDFPFYRTIAGYNSYELDKLVWEPVNKIPTRRNGNKIYAFLIDRNGNGDPNDYFVYCEELRIGVNEHMNINGQDYVLHKINLKLLQPYIVDCVCADFTNDVNSQFGSDKWSPHNKTWRQRQWDRADKEKNILGNKNNYTRDKQYNIWADDNVQRKYEEFENIRKNLNDDVMSVILQIIEQNKDEYPDIDNRLLFDGLMERFPDSTKLSNYIMDGFEHDSIKNDPRIPNNAKKKLLNCMNLYVNTNTSMSKIYNVIKYKHYPQWDDVDVPFAQISNDLKTMISLVNSLKRDFGIDTGITYDMNKVEVSG